MIDRLAFAKVMGGFADKIGRAVAPETAEMYFDVLGEALTTDEFLAGARIVFRSHGYNTWPSPEQFIAAAKPQTASTLTGAEAFEKVLSVTNDPRIADRNALILAMGPTVERAYRAAGGYREFANVLEADVKWLRKSFVEAYELAADSEVREADASRALATVNTPRLGQTEDAVAMIVSGLAAQKSFPPSGRDKALGERDAADD